MPRLSKIAIHPIKALNPVYVDSARIVEGGGLEHDREFAIFDADGNYVNGKRNEKVHFLQTQIDWKAHSLSIGRRGEPLTLFDLNTQLREINAWLSAYFEKPVELRRNVRGGFPDDKKNPGPTVLGASTLDEVVSWYEGISRSEIHTRFRANLEIGDAPAFWEDRLYAGVEEVVAFRIGKVLFHGANPCQRCVVPTRDTKTAEAYADFANIFRARREETFKVGRPVPFQPLLPHGGKHARPRFRVRQDNPHRRQSRDSLEPAATNSAFCPKTLFHCPHLPTTTLDNHSLIE